MRRREFNRLRQQAERIVRTEAQRYAAAKAETLVRHGWTVADADEMIDQWWGSAQMRAQAEARLTQVLRTMIAPDAPTTVLQ